jgi:putative peptidoglycan lipid II flippase
MSEKRTVLKAAGVVGFFTLVSRLTGLVRDSVLASIFGTSRVSDAFWFAFELPNMVRRVMGEGALSAFLVPLFSERLREGPEQGWRFFNRAANLMLLIALGLTVLGTVFAREAFMLMGGLGMALRDAEVALRDAKVPLESEMIELGVRMTRLMFPFVIGLTLSAVMMGACHTLGRFAAASLGSVMLNLSMIVVSLAVIWTRTEAQAGAIWLCWAVLAGAVLRVGLMVPTLWRGGWRWRPEFNFKDPQLRTLLSMMGLGLLALSISQVNILVSNFFAARLGEGIKTYLVYSNRLIQFPMALTATAVATAMLPQLSRLLVEGRPRELRDHDGAGDPGLADPPDALSAPQLHRRRQLGFLYGPAVLRAGPLAPGLDAVAHPPVLRAQGHDDADPRRRHLDDRERHPQLVLRFPHLAGPGRAGAGQHDRRVHPIRRDGLADAGGLGHPRR